MSKEETNKEVSKIQRERILSDAKLVEGRATVDEKSSISPTELQVSAAQSEMQREKSEVRSNSEQVYRIHSDASPEISPYGGKVEYHKKSGTIIWDPSAPETINPFVPEITKDMLFESTKTYDYKGNNFLDEGMTSKFWNLLDSKPVFNATILGELLKHNEMIPEQWKDVKYPGVPFWGTIYLAGGREYTREHVLKIMSLYFDGREWKTSNIRVSKKQ